MAFLNVLVIRILILATIVTFLLSGLVINVLQFINLLIVKRLSPRLSRQINYLLMYSSWSQVVACFDWFCHSKFRITHADGQLEEQLFKRHTIFLANHTYELDWIGAWLVTDKLGHLASCKAMLKKDLKYVPVVGWAWAMSDQIFLDREWEKDRHKLNRSLDALLVYEPMLATFFCEGSRFTKDKLENSLKFAEERNIQAPRHHLIPRTKGFVAVMNYIRQLQKKDLNLRVDVYDVQVAYEHDGANNLADIFDGKQARGHMLFRQIPDGEIPKDDEGCAQWLRELYVKKDEYEDHFHKYGKLPGHEHSRPYRVRLTSLANWLLWNSLVFSAIIRWIVKLYVYYGTFHVSILLSVFFAIGYLYLSLIVHQADVGKETDAKKKQKIRQTQEVSNKLNSVN